MSKTRKNRQYSDIDNHFICAMDGHCPEPIRKIIKPSELPFSIEGADSNSVIYADDYYHNNAYRLDDSFHIHDKPIVK